MLVHSYEITQPSSGKNPNQFFLFFGFCHFVVVRWFIAILLLIRAKTNCNFSSFWLLQAHSNETNFSLLNNCLVSSWGFLFALYMPLPQSTSLSNQTLTPSEKDQMKGWENIAFCLLYHFSFTQCNAMCKQSNRRAVFNMCLWMCQSMLLLLPLLLLLIQTNIFLWRRSQNYSHWGGK